MNDTGLLHRIVTLGLFGGLVIFLIVWTVKKAEEPKLMLMKWLGTFPVVGFLVFYVMPMVANMGADSAFVGVPLTAVSGLALAIIWRRNIANLVASPLASLYDGGTQPPDPHPFYSVARARQKQGQYLEAVAEVQKQLERFPTDVEGHLFLAEVQAENLHDLAAAGETVEQFCQQPNHAPQNITFALFSMADWHLKAGERDAAQRWLEEVIERLPDTEFALSAEQRIAHLATAERLLSPNERKTFVVLEGPRNLGLRKQSPPPPRAEKDPEAQAAEYVRHLQQYPFDMEAREQLAVIYADHYRRLDLATQELEQMITYPSAPARLVVHWLNLLADLQVRCGTDYDTVRQTLQRIIDLGPSLAAAEIARKRMDFLNRELKANQGSEAVKLGSYEQNIGLKRGSPQGLYTKPGPPGSRPRP